MNLDSSDWMLLAAGFLFALALIGCSVPHIDTNGYYSKPEERPFRSEAEHMKYCQQTRDKVIYFVPCSEIKHDINL